MGLKERYERLAGKEYNAVQLARAAKRRLEPVEGEASDGVPEDESVSSHLPPLPILLRSDSYVFVAKPAGTVVHRGKFTKKGDVPLVQRVRDQLGVRVNPVHRLDGPTTGMLQAAMQHAGARKTYYAFARGEAGWMDDHLEERPIKDDNGVLRDASTRLHCVGACGEGDERSSLIV